MFGCISCAEKTENSDIEIIDIKLKQMHEVISDSIIRDLMLIPLETNKNCLITHVDKIKKYEDKIYILDRKEGKILIFNLSGDFLGKVSHKGKGFGEYLLISDFDVHPQKNHIYILDGMTGKILVYQDDEFLKDYKPKFGSNVHSFCFLEGSKMVFNNQLTKAKKGLNYQLIYVDSGFDVIDKKIPYTRNSPSLVMSPISPFSYMGTRISFQPVYKDTIFHIEGLKLIPKYKLDFGDKWLDEDFLLDEKLDVFRFMKDLNKLDAINYLNTIESNSHLFVYFTHKHKKYAYLYDKSTKKGIFLKDYMINGCGYNGLPIIPDGDYFVGIVNPLELSNVNEEVLKKYPKLMDLQKGNNPIVSFIKFKEIN